MFEWLNTLFLEPERVFGLSSGTPFLSDCVSSFIRVAGSESSKKEKEKKMLIQAFRIAIMLLEDRRLFFLQLWIINEQFSLFGKLFSQKGV